MERLELNAALEAIWQAMTYTNGYFAEQAPWALRKTDPERANTILYHTLEAIRRLAIQVRWAIPEGADAVLALLGQAMDRRDFANLETQFVLEEGLILPSPTGVFPRLELPVLVDA